VLRQLFEIEGGFSSAHGERSHPTAGDHQKNWGGGKKSVNGSNAVSG
jgi:hypothetical protein